MRATTLTLISILVTVSVQSEWNKIKPFHVYVPPKNRIIGGNEVKPNSIPYQAGLRINENQYFCGGALISKNYVLTAAHCADLMQEVEVILGAHNISNTQETTQQRLIGQKIIIHENYNQSNYINDIALIELSESVNFNDYIQPIALPVKSEDYITLIAKATGWGLYRDVPFPSIRDMSQVLLEVDVPIMNITECEFYYNDEEFTWVTSGNICTSGYRNKGTCGGDSGGPLVLDGILIGITSFGSNLCELCTPSVYTRIDQFLDWIKSNSDL